MNSTMRFHALTDNTSNYLQGSNNFPYGAPPKLEDNEMDYGEVGWADVPEKFINLDTDEEAAKCFSCGGWFPWDSCVVNHDEECRAVPVCETCASGRVG